MNYRVLIPTSIKREIGQLPRQLMLGVLHKLLGELPSNPNQYLGEVVVPLAARAYSFTLQDSNGQTHWFVALIDGLDPAANPDLRVVGLRHTDFDPSSDTYPP